MADGIRFKEFLVCNTETNKCIEENAKTLFSYANVHDRNFDDTLSDDFTILDASTWDVAGASVYATWTSDPPGGGDAQLKGVGGGDGDWDHLLSVDDMPSEGILAVYKNCNRGGIVFRGTDRQNHYLFFWDADSVGFKKCTGGSYTTLADVPKVYTGEGDITLSWREMKFRRTADEKWLFMSAWVDGELAVTTESDISNSTPGKKVGFAVYDSDTVYFDDIRIPELTEIVDWCSLDIGEAPAGAISRMIGRRHIKYFLRYDGTLRMWRPKSASSTWTYQRHITGFHWNVDDRNLVSHWRQVGAWEEADRFDTTLLQKGVHRFHKDDNADLMTKEACYNEAGYAIQRLKEVSNRVDMGVPAQVLQEPEDVVTVLFVRDGNTIINSVDYIIDLEQGLSITFQDEKLGSVLHLRKKV